MTNKQLSHDECIGDAHSFPLSILANNVEIAGNIGSLFRIADSFAVEKLYLTGDSATPPKYKIRKAARSTEHKVPFEYQESALKLVKSLKQQNYIILSLEITESSINLRDFHFANDQSSPQAICLIVGAENKGIDQDLLDLSDHCIHIPMYGNNSSMNVTTACAIALYELVQLYP